MAPIKNAIIPVGEVDGQSHKIFRFMDLPAELRNSIYHYLLVAPNEIRISRHQRKTGALRIGGRKPGSRRMEYTITAVTMIDRKAKVRKLHVGKEHPLAILRINKVTNAEATAIFCGANRFTFDTAFSIDEFRSVSGGNFNLVKDIHIKSVTNMSLGKLSRAICKLEAPTSIKIAGFPFQRVRGNIAYISNFLFRDIISDFMLKKWKGPKNDGTETTAADQAEVDRRFATLHFVADNAVFMKLENGTVVMSDKSNNFLHDFIAPAVYERFKEHVAQKTEYLERRRTEMLAS